MTTTTTPNPTYQAVKDAAIKVWHLGSAERGHMTYCGVELMHAADRRRFTLRLPEADRHHDVNDDLTRITCKACKRTREYAYATGTAERPAPSTGTTTTRRRRAAGTSSAGTTRVASAERMAAQARAARLAQAEQETAQAGAAVLDAEATPEERRAIAGSTANPENAVDPAEQTDGSAPRRRAARKSRSKSAKAQEALARDAERAAAMQRADDALGAIAEALNQVAEPVSPADHATADALREAGVSDAEGAAAALDDANRTAE